MPCPSVFRLKDWAWEFFSRRLESFSRIGILPILGELVFLKDIHDKILQPKKIFQRDRVSDVVLVGFLSVFGFTFIHLLTTAERKNYAVEGSRCINLSAGMPMNRTFAERLKLLKDFWGHSSREGYFSSKDGYAYQKEGGKTLKTCRKMSQFL